MLDKKNPATIDKAAAKRLGARIRQARVARGLSQEDLGDCLKKTRSAVSLWEAGDSIPADIPAIAKKLNVQVAWLTTGKGKPPTKVKQAPTGYRRQMVSRMELLIRTGMFDELLERLGYVKKNSRDSKASLVPDK
jgi:transcriptional regulator with XRE-family HTH domain